MRAAEFLIERVIHSGWVNDIFVEISDHTHHRNERREASPRAVDSIINKLHTCDKNIRTIEPPAGKFWVYSTKWNTAIGCMRKPDKDGKLSVIVNTLLSDPPHAEGIVPVFYIP